MGRLFGTDGARGVAITELTCETAMQIGKAAAIVLTKTTKHKPTIFIGKDTRISSDILEAALAAGICSVGANAQLLGVVPTPAVAALVEQKKADAGVMISASHNSFEFNGIKLFSSTGYKLSDEMEEEIEELILDRPEDMKIVSGAEVGKMTHYRDAQTDYIRYIMKCIKGNLTGLRIAIDCANGSASATAKRLFEGLGADVYVINSSPDGININNGCGSTHMETLCRGVVAGKYDLGIAFDGDADRCLLVDEKGHIIDGDKVLAVCGKAMRRKGSLNGNAIVATVMSNLGLHEFCRKGDFLLVCTDVGDRHVLEKMIECGYMIGGEQSGHTIFREYATTGDGELTALQFIQAYCEAGVPASELVSCCAQYPQELINVPVSAVGGAKERIMADDRLWEQVRSQEEALNGEGRILVRPSGTEALIRVMVEAKTVEVAHNVAMTLAEFIKTL